MEKLFKGKSLSEGISIGVPFFLPSLEIVEKGIISHEESLEEVTSCREAILRSKEDLCSLKEQFSTSVSAILDSHIQILEDPMLLEMVERVIEKRRRVGSIFNEFLKEYRNRETLKDVKDVFRRILKNMFLKSSLAIPKGAILLSEEIVPSDTAEADPQSVLAFVAENGGYFSHAAIIARAKKMPYVVNIDLKKLRSLKLENIIVDGGRGFVIANPSSATVKKYSNLERTKKEEVRGIYMKDLGRAIISANTEKLEEVDLIIKEKALGVGLFRTENMLFGKKDFPSEEEQFLIYREFAKKLAGLPLVIRVFDVGEDSFLTSAEDSPLGCRGIRFLVKHEKVLNAQLRAILRASSYGNIKILVPMVMDLAEMRDFKERVKMVQKELKGTKKVEIGSMVEVPAMALMAKELAEEVDFLSIGSNDLTQYTLAMERKLYSFKSHPAVLFLIKEIAKAQKPVILCGELAGDLRFTEILLGLGVKEFSVAPSKIGLLRQKIDSIDLKEAEKKASYALNLLTAKDLSDFIERQCNIK